MMANDTIANDECDHINISMGEAFVINPIISYILSLTTPMSSNITYYGWYMYCTIQNTTNIRVGY
jgi:hypothetical protein